MPDLAALSHEEDKEDSDLEDTPLDPSGGTNSLNSLSILLFSSSNNNKYYQPVHAQLVN
jgi:hypothetical protein